MRRKTAASLISFSFAVLLTVGLAAWLQALAAQAAQEKAAWDVTLKPEVQARSELEIENRCKRTHSFQVTKENLDFLEFQGEPRVTVPGHSSKTLPVRFNTDGMAGGEYRGNVVVKCLTCASEPTCTHQAPLCQWQTIHLGYDAVLEEVYIRSVQENAGKNTNVEIEKIPPSTAGPAIRYHCTVDNGTAVITYTYSVGQDKKVGRLLVSCTP